MNLNQQITFTFTMNKLLVKSIWISLIVLLVSIVSDVQSEDDVILEPIRFAGYEWDYKVGNKRGPGPNIFKLENIQVDSEDRLHLHIHKDPHSSNWSCGEVYTRKTGFGYGLYSWTLETDVSNFDPSVVVGLYTWDSKDTNKVEYNREIDIEFSRWNNPKDKTNAQFVVQPYYLRSNIVRFTQPNTNLSIHEFLWTEDNIKFRSYDLSGNILSWDFNQPGQEKKKVFTPGNGVSVRMNLWLWRHIPPTKDHHIIISDFSYTPIDNLEGIYFE